MRTGSAHSAHSVPHPVHALLPAVPLLLLDAGILGSIIGDSSLPFIIGCFATVISLSIVSNQLSAVLDVEKFEWYDLYAPRFFMMAAGDRWWLAALVSYTLAAFPVISLAFLFFNVGYQFFSN